MSDIAIRVQGLSKQYQIWSKVERYKTLRESIVNAATDPIRRFRGGWNGSGGLETIWALKDVSFEVKRGEVVGIIGRNGAGKSTLLKLLSRITRPSAGRAEVYGRVGSLLEVGTGFHPELTGRENIYLNGAILGMRKAEIDRKFDEIVAFAETEKFLDTPVKHYSSGMFVRLAFAVAAHLEAEILMVDEVLAVGDAPFQEKCLGKMSDVARGGRAVLFVSHNTSAVASLCERCLLLDRGALQMAGGASAVIESYQSSIHALMAQTSDLSKADHYGSGKARFTSVKLAPQSPDGIDRPYLQPGNDLQVDLEIHSDAEIPGVNVCVIVFDSSGYRLIDANTALHSDFIDLKAGQRVRVRFCLKHLLLKPGLYIMGLWMGRGSFEHIDGVTYATSFDVAPNPEAVVHPEVFPGVYQCVFTHAIEIGDAGPSFR